MLWLGMRSCSSALSLFGSIASMDAACMRGEIGKGGKRHVHLEITCDDSMARVHMLRTLIDGSWTGKCRHDDRLLAPERQPGILHVAGARDWPHDHRGRVR